MNDETANVNAAIDKVDVLYDQFVDLNDLLKRVLAANEGRQVQTVIYRHAGVGGLNAAAIVACFATWLGLIVFALYAIPELHDLRAWRDIHSNDIATLKAKIASGQQR